MIPGPPHLGCRQFTRTMNLRFPAVLAVSLILAAPLYAQPAPPADGNGFVNTLMPLPVTLMSKPGNLRIESSFSFAFRDKSGERLRQGVVRLLSRIELRSGIALVKESASLDHDATLTIDVAALLNPAAPTLGEDESYTLDVDEHRVLLHAPTDVGALRGMETLLQLVQPAGNGFVFPGLHIEDAPRFPWRGLLIDAGRHYITLPVIYRTLDGMAAVKLNLLHWHLTEDQGFRIESRVYPKLHELGSERLYYTQQQVREVIAYAAARGIRVVPEFDMPGHSTSWMVGYPELGSAPGPYSVDRRFGILDPAMNPINESTYRFLDAFLGEMSKLFPDAYIHIGGDESNGKQWLANPRIKAFMDAHGMKTTPELQAYFNVRLQKILAKYHKQMVGWDEVLSPALKSDVVIQSWRTNESLVEAAKLGHRGFYSHPYYLDHMYTAAEVFQTNPISADAALTPEQAKLILGGEACMWSEMVDSTTIDSRIWPRAAAVAERFWSPATDQDTEDMYRRLSVESLRLEAEGLMHISGPIRIQRQIAGVIQIQPLEMFVSTLQPVDFHIRGKEQQITKFTVLDRVVDAARFDPPLRHEFELLVRGALNGSTADMDRLETIFHSWIDASPALDHLEANSPLLQEVSAHIAAWPKLGSLGIEAVHYLRTGEIPHAGWLDTQKVVLHDAVKPSELVDFVFLDPLGKLVAAAGAPKRQ